MAEKLDHGYWHEALDRTHVVQSLFADQVRDHPVIQQHPELDALAEAAGRALMDLYQGIGQKYPDFECHTKDNGDGSL